MVPPIPFKRALKRYQDKQLARYHAFITSQSPYFQTILPNPLGPWINRL